jgi:hypothetical protein
MRRFAIGLPAAAGLMLAVLAAGPMAPAQSQSRSQAQSPAMSVKPKVPAGHPSPGQGAVAVLSTGVDYTLPLIFNRLARDGEGELIGWDFVDDDRRPFAPRERVAAQWHGGDVTAMAMHWPMRYVHVRVDPERPPSLAAAVEWLARSPARIVVVPMWSRDRALWEGFRSAAERQTQQLFIVAAGDEGSDIDATPVYPAAFKLANMIVVSAVGPRGAAEQGNVGARSVDLFMAPASAVREAPGGTQDLPRNSREAAFEVANLFFCHRPPPGLREELRRATSAADVRAIIVARARRERGWPGPVLEACQPL